MRAAGTLMVPVFLSAGIRKVKLCLSTIHEGRKQGAGGLLYG